MQFSPEQNYSILQHAVSIEIIRLIENPSALYKVVEIHDALTRIFLTIKRQQPEKYPITHSKNALVRINPFESSTIDLSSLQSMLDAKISQWAFSGQPDVEDPIYSFGFREKLSLREALNISRNNIIPGNWGPLWGKTTSLTQVENKLGLQN